MSDELQLSLSEADALAACEAVIEKGMRTFVAVSNALTEIRDNCLYRQDYSTFDEYCRKRWCMSGSRAYQTMSASA